MRSRANTGATSRPRRRARSSSASHTASRNRGRPPRRASRSPAQGRRLALGRGALRRARVGVDRARRVRRDLRGDLDRPDVQQIGGPRRRPPRVARVRAVPARRRGAVLDVPSVFAFRGRRVRRAPPALALALGRLEAGVGRARSAAGALLPAGRPVLLRAQAGARGSECADARRPRGDPCRQGPHRARGRDACHRPASRRGGPDDVAADARLRRVGGGLRRGRHRLSLPGPAQDRGGARRAPGAADLGEARGGPPRSPATRRRPICSSGRSTGSTWSCRAGCSRRG
jgi:hypothetical protein